MIRRQPDDLTLTIGGKRWRLCLRSVAEDSALRDCGGYCTAPDQPGKRIVLPRSLLRHPQRLLRVLLHEVLHAADWNHDDEWIDQTAVDLARAIRRVKIAD